MTSIPYPYDEKATVGLITTCIAASKLLESNGLYANMAITLNKAKDLTDRFIYEEGGKSSNLSGFNEEITPRIDKATSKIYGRTRYELDIINRDKKGGAANEDLIGQSISSGFSNGKPSNLIVSSHSFSKLSGEELASYRKVNTPNKFIMSLEITSIETDETRNEPPLSKEYISHYVTEDNPQYDVAVNRYNTEVDNYNAAMADYRKQKADIDNKAKDYGLLGLALSVGMSLVQPSRAALDNAKAELNNTPKTVKKTYQ
ncbi:MAG: hypothetical protein HY096_10765 [Nitrospinae bacterium]|nr:hypothetical protein [Nitrospinota bacterium]